MADICHECENPAWTGKTIEAPAMPGGGEGGTSDFNALDNRPKYDGVKMTGNTNIPNVSRDIERLDGDVEDIQELIPETATPENQLADKDFVNSSVATNTANFVGTYNSLEELEAVENPSNNDYGFVISTDEQGNTVFNRYKYVSSVESWEFEYALNNSSFTAVQWAAINSGITEGNVEKINAILEIKSVGNGLVLENNGQLRQKLYTETGNNTDAAMDQKTVSEAIDAIYGRARELTAADYNYPTNNPTQIALWLLEPGIYTWPSDMANAVRLSRTMQADVGVAIVTNRVAGYTTVLGIPANFGYLDFAMVTSDGTASRYWEIMPSQNNLTSTSSTAPLSANQGRVLNEKIGDLSSLNTTDKTNTVAAINEVAGNIGKAKILTSADYNYPVNNPIRVAAWTLAPGIYAAPEANLALTTSNVVGYGHLVLVNRAPSGGANIMDISISDNNVMFYRTNSFGGVYTTTKLLSSLDVVNNLISTSATTPLSASQGKVLKDLIDGKQDALTAGNGIEIDSENVISIVTISAEDWSALWQ